MSEIALLGLGKLQKEESREFWWAYSLFCRYGRWIYDRTGQKEPTPPPPCGIGLLPSVDGFHFLSFKSDNWIIRGFTSLSLPIQGLISKRWSEMVEDAQLLPQVVAGTKTRTGFEHSTFSSGFVYIGQVFWLKASKI